MIHIVWSGLLLDIVSMPRVGWSLGMNWMIGLIWREVRVLD
jgi:hypothetical protein